ncbi:MAG: hypothetical protein ACYCQI_13075 [Gammaproteobacteria bacterium]
MLPTRETGIHNGDFLIELTRPSGLEIDMGTIPGIDVTKMGQLSFQAVKEAIPDAAFHGMIFNYGVDETEGKPIAEIFHSADGYRFKGVKTNDFLAEKILTDKDGFSIGHIVVLRPRNAKINAEVAQVAQRWAKVDIKKFLGLDSKATKADIRAAVADKHSMVLSTKWVYSRDKDQKDVQELFELFRAFRAHYRNCQNPPEPVSKHKGASCSSFAFTVFKVAIINVLFPPALIAKIYSELQALNKLKKAKGLTKLKQLGRKIPHFSNIKKMVDDFANRKQAQESETDFQNRKKYIAALSYRIKGFNIESFCEYVMKSGLCDVVGYLYLKEAATPAAISIMDHATLQKLLKIRKTETAPLVVSKEELAQLAVCDLSQAERGFFGGKEEAATELKSSVASVRPKVSGGDSSV